MKGHWHIVAMSVGMTIVTIIYNNVIFLVGAFIWLSLLYYFKRIGKIPLVFSLFLSLYFLYYIPSPEMVTSEANLTQGNQELIGQIISPKIITNKKVDFVFQDKKTEDNIQVIFFLDNNKDPGIDVTSLKLGASCKINGKIELPDTSTNPGQFDYRGYLQSKGIAFQLVLNSINDIECVGSSLFNNIFSSREKLIFYIEKKVSKETAAWLNALVLGNDSLLDEETLELFQRWSLSHILAISGLHVGLIIGLLYFALVKFNLVTKEKANWFILIFLPLYALLAGGAPSVWRASLMAFMFLVINKIKLNYSVTDILGLVCLILIIFDRYIIYHIGFQLSFLVTFGLVLSRNWISQTNRLWQPLLISFTAQMMILPLLFIYFSIFQPLSILLNVIVVLYFSVFVIPFMFILLLLSPLSTLLTNLLDILFQSVHKPFISLIFFIDEFFDYPWIIGKFPIFIVVLYYSLFILFMIKIEESKLKHAFKYGISIVVLITGVAVQPYLSSTGVVTMLDIGQGDAFIIELPYRKGVIFVDAGSTFSYDDFKPNSRVYKQVIRPYLYSRGINKVDAIIISHEHVDHYGSVQFLLSDMDVDDIILSEFYQLEESIEKEWLKYDVNIHRVILDDTFVVKGQQFHVVAPAKNVSVNDNSLVVNSNLGGKNWLFTGDIGKGIEREIISQYPKLSVDVVKIAHHGSDTSTDKKFIEEIGANFALIPVGVNNSYNHPSEEVINTLEDRNLTVLRTDEDGAVQFYFKNNKGTFFKFLP